MDLQLADKTVLVTGTTRSSTVGLTKSPAKERPGTERANGTSRVRTDSLDAHTGGSDDERMRKILAQYPLRRPGALGVVRIPLQLPRPLRTTGRKPTAGTRRRGSAGRTPSAADLREDAGGTGRGTYVSDLQLPRTNSRVPAQPAGARPYHLRRCPPGP